MYIFVRSDKQKLNVSTPKALNPLVDPHFPYSHCHFWDLKAGHSSQAAPSAPEVPAAPKVEE